MIVESSIADALVERMEANFQAVKAGPTWYSDTTLSPIISQKQAERIDRLVRQTVDEGATIRLGGGVFEDRNAGSYYRPTILEGVLPGMTGFKEEFFGPVVTIDRFDAFEAGPSNGRPPDLRPSRQHSYRQSQQSPEGGR